MHQDKIGIITAEHQAGNELCEWLASKTGKGFRPVFSLEDVSDSEVIIHVFNYQEKSIFYLGAAIGMNKPTAIFSDTPVPQTEPYKKADGIYYTAETLLKALPGLLLLAKERK